MTADGGAGSPASQPSITVRATAYVGASRRTMTTATSTSRRLSHGLPPGIGIGWETMLSSSRSRHVSGTISRTSRSRTGLASARRTSALVVGNVMTPPSRLPPALPISRGWRHLAPGPEHARTASAPDGVGP